jgi:small subunit ribosomal protein S11
MTDEKTTKVEEAKDEASIDTTEEKSGGKTSKVKKAPPQAKYVRTAKGRKRAVKTVPRGRAYIHASLNNTIVTLTDPNGNVLTWASAGGSGFRGPKKATPFAASQVIEKLAEKAERFGLKDIHIIITGIGGGRDSAVRSLNAKGFNILSIKEVTPMAHNGCRPRRPRRV